MGKHYVNVLKKSMRSSNGITLVALVITIIVLLVLTGISITMISGENGLLNRAKQAKEDSTVGQEKEQVELAYLSATIKKIGENVTEQNLQDELDASVGENKTTVTGTNTLKVKFIDTQNEYKVSQDGKVEKKNGNPNALEISEIYENAGTYFGWDVINYAETLPAELQDIEWQLFYAGPLEGETEERIYLISKGCVKNTVLPTVIKNGAEVEGAKPIAISGSDYKAIFGNDESDGVMPQYSGSEDIAENMKKYNKDYFKDYTSTRPNMKAVAYMLDTTTWAPFANSSKEYAEWAIGGPSVELLFLAYNKYKGLTGSSARVADACSLLGYKISKDGRGELCVR